MHRYHFLQLFSEGAAAPAAEGTGDTTAPAQPEAAPDPGAEFDALIRGKYKDQYAARVQDTIHKRLRSSRETVEKFNTLTPALKLLSEHYGTADGDMAALARAVEADNSFYQRQAEQRGLDVKHMRAIRALEQENAALKNNQYQHLSQLHARRQYDIWSQQADEAKTTYPELDMNIECQNPRFRSLLRSGLDVETAYLVMHKDRLLQQAADSAQQMLANKLMASPNRPSENGTSGQSAAVTRYDVASMSRSDRENIRKRAARGERIRF